MISQFRLANIVPSADGKTVVATIVDRVTGSRTFLQMCMFFGRTATETRSSDSQQESS